MNNTDECSVITRRMLASLVQLCLKLFHLGCLINASLARQDRFTTIRSSSGTLPDKFILPTSQCVSSMSARCSILYSGAVNHDPTQCKCACRYEDSTFGFENQRWSCIKNSEVRQKAACGFMFDGEHKSKPLDVLARRSHNNVILPSHSCTINHSASRYLKCDGTWRAIGQSSTFQFLPLAENIGSGKYRHSLMVIAPGPLKGRIVSLNISCKNPSRTSCLVFKLAGHIKCPVDIVSFSSTSVSFTNSPSTRKPFSNASIRNSSTEPTGPDEDQYREVIGTPSGTIAAVVIIVIFIIIILTITALVIWKRKRGESVLFMDHLINIARKVRSSPATKKVEEPEEQIYAEIPEHPTRQIVNTSSTTFDTGIYSFAYDDPNSAYAQTKKTCSKIPEEASIDDRGYMVPVDSPSHNGPDPQNTDRNQIPYIHGNHQERQKTIYKGRMKSDAPFYDILETPDQQNTEINKQRNQTLCYNQRRGHTHRGGNGERFVSSASAAGASGARGSNGYVTKQRRRPPSPPRRI